ncbi:MAG TPA: hypothetical protein VH170_04295 [Chthoniobacterales bacterium]|nr:hypothetical protein [Chthoniobacterales bacterium]
MIGGLFPVWLTIIGLALTKQAIKVAIFTDNGEFAIYSASYVAGTLYILFRDFQHPKATSFPSRSVLGLAFSVLLLSSAAMFMVVCLFGVLAQAAPWSNILTILDRDALRVMSLVVFPLAMFLSFLVVVADNIRIMPDLNQMARNQLNELGDEFDRLQ